MATVSERVRLMKENFMVLHNDGKTIPEIAASFNLSRCTVYHRLDEIAKENGTSREKLLQQVHKVPSYWEHEQKQMHVDIDELNRNFDTANEALTSIINQIDTILEVEKNVN